MADTYSRIYLQIVFVVKRRENLIQKAWMDELHKYICGIVTAKQQKVYAIGGVADHIHILLSIKPDILLSDLVRDIKSNSSRWINERGYVDGKFQWQHGYGAFSYSHFHLDTIIAYINNQEEHHRKKSFKQEYKKLLEEYQVSYKDEYLFEWIE